VVENPRFGVGICYDVCHTFEDISISGLGSHAAISGCPSMSYLFVNAFVKLFVVENVAFTTSITVILTLEAFSGMS